MGVIVDLPEYELWVRHIACCARERGWRQYEPFDDSATHVALRSDDMHKGHQIVENGRALGISAHYWWERSP